MDEYKFIALGDGDVGKTSLILRWADDTFQPRPENIDYKSRILTIGEKTVKITLIDTAGQERYRTLTSSYYREADVVLVVFDLTREDTWKDIGIWIDDGRKYTNDAFFYLVGNKLDLVEEDADKRKVVAQEVDHYVDDRDLGGYMETSAKTGKNVDDLFMGLVNRFAGKIPGALPRDDRVDLNASIGGRKKRCQLL